MNRPHPANAGRNRCGYATASGAMARLTVCTLDPQAPSRHVC